MSTDPSMIQTSNLDQEKVNQTTSSQPPSYNSLNFINQLKSAKEESKNPAHFAGSACLILCESVFATICLILSLSIPIVSR
jgi:hypothetical protein